MPRRWKWEEQQKRRWKGQREAVKWSFVEFDVLPAAAASFVVAAASCRLCRSRSHLLEANILIRAKARLANDGKVRSLRVAFLRVQKAPGHRCDVFFFALLRRK